MPDSDAAFLRPAEAATRSPGCRRPRSAIASTARLGHAAVFAPADPAGRSSTRGSGASTVQADKPTPPSSPRPPAPSTTWEASGGTARTPVARGGSRRASSGWSARTASYGACAGARVGETAPRCTKGASATRRAFDAGYAGSKRAPATSRCSTPAARRWPSSARSGGSSTANPTSRAVDPAGLRGGVDVHVLPPGPGRYRYASWARHC